MYNQNTFRFWELSGKPDAECIHFDLHDLNDSIISFVFSTCRGDIAEGKSWTGFVSTFKFLA